MIHKTAQKSKKIIKKYYKSLKNIYRYGTSAPRVAEKIWVDPKKCTKVFNKGVIKKLTGSSSKIEYSGKVIESYWPSEKSFKITDLPKQSIDNWYAYRANGVMLTYEYSLKFRFKFCIEHWVYGMSWEETGVYEFMESAIKMLDIRIDYCSNIKDIYMRYENLDRIFEQVKREGRLRTIEEVDPGYAWEEKEPVVHIGPKGECFFQPHGVHRFAIAYILNLPFPAQIGLVHISALPYLQHFRK